MALSSSENLAAVYHNDGHETKTRACFVDPLFYSPCAIPHGQLIPCSGDYEGMRATRCGYTIRLAFQTTGWGVS